MILVYTQHDEASKLTLQLLTQHNIAFRHIDVSGDRKLVATLSAAGYKEFPVVMIGNDVWTGYRPEKLKQIVRDPTLRGPRRTA